ncbi:MAG: alpha/beta hydrolase [Bacteroides sp.]|nr:alpha/beta hydrolase [Roseburia sp.]MCM1345785.1 alpha/beta hydrolase [Bacteroides sp.]MCM1420513.1 alpha/beta hydrolase [Bacteroides sp.]
MILPSKTTEKSYVCTTIVTVSAVALVVASLVMPMITAATNKAYAATPTDNIRYKITEKTNDNISGTWNGSLKITPQVELKIVFNFKSEDDGKQSVTLDSPNQGVYGITGEVNILSNDSVNVTIKSIGLSFAGRKQEGKLIGIYSQGAMKTALELYPGTVELKRPQTPRSPFPYTTKEIKLNNSSDNITLSGTLTLPKDYTTSTPSVVMVTGSGLQNRDEELYRHKPFAVIADYLARNSIASLRYDDRGYGESTGDGTIATTEDFARDARTALEYMRIVENFNNVGLLGHSEGATIAFMLGAEHNTNVHDSIYITDSFKPDFIVAIGAQAVRGDTILTDQSAILLKQQNMSEDMISDYVEALYKMYDLKITKGNNTATDSIDAICKKWNNTHAHTSLKTNLKSISSDTNPWLNFYIRFSPAKSISATHCPVFVLYGEKDIQVRPELNMPQMKNLAPKAQIKLYPELNHLFQHAQTGAIQEYGIIEETISPEVLQDIADFILSTNQ